MKKFACFLLSLALCVSVFPVFAEKAPLTYYGRECLAARANAADLLFAYDALVAGVADRETAIAIDSSVHPLSPEDGSRVIEAYIGDRGCDYWVNTVFEYVGTYVNSFQVTYSAFENGAEEAFNNAVNRIYSAAEVDTLSTEREKALAIHDELCKNVYYHETADYCHSAYGALVDGVAVCDGYSEAYQTLLQKAGICAYRVIGTAQTTEGYIAHAWLLLRLDGEYYYSDVTWDDYGSIPEEIHHEYFASTEEIMGIDHILDSTLLLPLPECTATAADWFVQNDCYVTTSLDTAKFASQLKKNGYVCIGVVGENHSNILTWFVNNTSALMTACDMHGSVGLSYYVYTREIHLFFYVRGDMNNDNLIGAADLTALARAVGSVEPMSRRDSLAGDVDGKDGISAADVTKLARYAAGIVSKL